MPGPAYPLDRRRFKRLSSRALRPVCTISEPTLELLEGTHFCAGYVGYHSASHPHLKVTFSTLNIWQTRAYSYATTLLRFANLRGSPFKCPKLHSRFIHKSAHDTHVHLRTRCLGPPKPNCLGIIVSLVSRCVLLSDLGILVRQ